MIAESKDEMAWRLVWSSQWRLQQESRHIEPTLPKMIGHMSVYHHVSNYMQTHDVSNDSSPEDGTIDTDVGQVEDIILGGDEDDDDPASFIGELSYHTTPVPKNNAQPSRPALVRSSSVVATVVEIDDDEAEVEAEAGRNPFSDDDDEETSSRGDGENDDDDGDWSSDEETAFDSVSSVGDEIEADNPLTDKLSAIHEEEGEAAMETFMRRQST